MRKTYLFDTDGIRFKRDGRNLPKIRSSRNAREEDTREKEGSKRSQIRKALSVSNGEAKRYNQSLAVSKISKVQVNSDGNTAEDFRTILAEVESPNIVHNASILNQYTKAVVYDNYDLKNDDRDLVLELFDSAVTQLRNASKFDNLEFINPQTLSTFIYALKLVDPKNASELMPKLASAIKPLADSIGGFDIQAVTMSFYGLHEKQYRLSPELFNFILEQLENNDESFDELICSNILYSLNNQDSSFSEQVLACIEKKIANCQDEFNSEKLAQSFYGLFNQNPNSCEGIIDTLNKKLKANQETLSLLVIAMIFYGLHGHKTEAAKDTLQILTKKFKDYAYSKEQPKGEMEARQIAMILFGLSEFENNDIPNELLDSLAAKVLGFKAIDFKTNLAEATRIFRKVEHTKLLDAYKNKFNAIVKDRPHPNSKNTIASLQSLLRELATITYLDASKTDFVELRDKLSYLNEETYHTGKPASLAERIAKETLDDLEIESQPARYIDGIELDLYLPNEKINIELDGIFHNSEAQKADDKLRDEYLKQTHGIDTIRINIDHSSSHESTRPSHDQYVQFIDQRVKEGLKKINVDSLD